MPTNDPTPSGKPKAYLNWILLDDQLKYVSSYPQSGAIGVGAAGTSNPLAYTGLPITKNGFFYIWVSNETPNWDVFFDNLKVTQYTGPEIEETHYYPFGVIMAGISSKALKSNYYENKYKYNTGAELQNKEFSDQTGIEMYDFHFRSFDPQIGRFMQIDPVASLSHNMSTYTFANDNPILYVDPFSLDTTTTQVDKNGNMQVKSNPEKGDIVKVVNKDGSSSYYTYDPKSRDASEQGYAGSGTETTLAPVTVTPQKKDDGAAGVSSHSTTGNGIDIAKKISEKVERSLVESEAVMVTFQTVMKMKPMQYIKEVPILGKINPIVTLLNTANQVSRFIDHPNWKDGLELFGQLAIAVACPECELLQLGYNMVTATIDMVEDEKEKAR